MGKVLTIKDADFSQVAVTNIKPEPIPGTLMYETVPDLNKKWQTSGGANSESYSGYVQITVDGISCYHSKIAGIEGKFANGANLQLIKVNALTKEYSILKSFTGDGSVQTIMFDSIINFETNEYVGIGVPPQSITQCIYYDTSPGNCTTVDIPYNNLNNRYAYRRIYVA